MNLIAACGARDCLRCQARHKEFHYGRYVAALSKAVRNALYTQKGEHRAGLISYPPSLDDSRPRSSRHTDVGEH
jgi:hypothetical protein